MAKPQTVARDQPEAAGYEQELADYLQERIKPGLNSGAIPLLARSIAKEIAHRDRPSNGSVSDREDEDEEPKGDAGEEPTGDAEEDDPQAGSDDDDAEADADAGEPEADEDSEDEDDDEPEAEADEDSEDEDDDDEPEAESDGEVSDFEADMHDLQSELGEDWILRFSVHGDDAWLTAEKADGSQHVEAATAEVLSEAVQLLEEGGRSR